MNLNLLGQAADVLYMKLHNHACQSQLIDCFNAKQCWFVTCCWLLYKLSSWVSEESKKVWEMGRTLNPHL